MQYVAPQVKAPKQLDLPLPDLDEEEDVETELSDDDLDVLQQYGEGVSFLEKLDTKKLDK